MAAPPPFNPLYSPCVSLHPFRASIYLLSLSLPLLVSYLPRYRPLSLTRSRSDDEFIGGSRAEWSCIWPTECFVRRANVENEAFIGGRRCDARHRTASSSTFPSYCRLPPRSTPSSSYPLLATCLLLTDRGEKIMNRSYSSSSFFEIQSQLQQSCSCKMEVPFLRLFFLLNRLFFFIGYSEIIVVNIVYFVLYCSFELEWIDVSQWLRDKTWLVPSKGAFFILTCWKKESWSASRIRISSSSETSKLCFTHTFVTHVDVAHVIRLVPSKFFDVIVS